MHIILQLPSKITVKKLTGDMANRLGIDFCEAQETSVKQRPEELLRSLRNGETKELLLCDKVFVYFF